MSNFRDITSVYHKAIFRPFSRFFYGEITAQSTSHNPPWQLGLQVLARPETPAAAELETSRHSRRKGLGKCLSGLSYKPPPHGDLLARISKVGKSLLKPQMTDFEGS